MSRPPSLDEIYYIAKKAVAIFAKHSLRCCLVGGAACALYGLDRCPNVSRESNLVRETRSLINDTDTHMLTGPRSCRSHLRLEIPTRGTEAAACRRQRLLLPRSLAQSVRHLQSPLVQIAVRERFRVRALMQGRHTPPGRAQHPKRACSAPQEY